jgi:exonuclease III
MMNFLFSSNIDVLGLVETRLMENRWPLRIRGYQTFSKWFDGSRNGVRGVSLVVRDTISCHLVPGVGSDNHLWVLAQFSVPVYLCVVYIPVLQNSEERLDVSVGLKNEIADLQSKHPRFGDLNVLKKSDKDPSSVYMERIGLNPFAWESSCMTFHREGKPVSSLDAFLSSEGYLRQWNAKVRVLDEIDTSDHWPIMLDLPICGNSCSSYRQSYRKLTIDLSKFNDCKDLWRKHNLWMVLDNEMDAEENEIDFVEQKFLQTASLISDNLGCKRVINKNSRFLLAGKQKLSSKARMLMKRRRCLWLKVRKLSSCCEYNKHKDAVLKWKIECKEVQKQLKVDSMKHWERKMIQGVNLGNGNDFRGFGNWCRNIGLRQSRNYSNNVVKDVNRNIALTPDEVKNVWFSHYTKLLSSGDGRNLQDFVVNDMDEVSPLNIDIFEEELFNVLEKLRNGKTAVIDGNPYECFKTLQKEDPLFCVVLKILNLSWRSGAMPKSW